MMGEEKDTQGKPGLTSDEIKVLLEEYRALRQEIRSVMSMGVHILSISVIAAGALLGYIIQQSITGGSNYGGEYFFP